MLKGLSVVLNLKRIKSIFVAFSAGAFGVFEATDDISDICKAKVFKRGAKTRLLIRFSTVGRSQ